MNVFHKKRIQFYMVFFDQLKISKNKTNKLELIKLFIQSNNKLNKIS